MILDLVIQATYLKKLPLDRLKIDKSFIQQLDSTQNETDVIVRAIISIAHSLNLDVLAEGVETKAQIENLKKLNGWVMGRFDPKRFTRFGF